MIKQILSAEQIAQRVQELGREITQDYQGKTLDMIGILKGSFIFMADLVRCIDLDLTLDFMRVSSYENNENTGNIKLEYDVTQPIKDKHVLIIEDIVETGTTLRYLLKAISAREPASLKLCSLLHKPGRTQSKVQIDYVGFEIDDAFVIGYGLDYKGLRRNLPYVGIY